MSVIECLKAIYIEIIFNQIDLSYESEQNHKTEKCICISKFKCYINVLLAVFNIKIYILSFQIYFEYISSYLEKTVLFSISISFFLKLLLSLSLLVYEEQPISINKIFMKKI